MQLTYFLVYVLCIHALVQQLSGHDGNTSLAETTNAVFRLPGTTVPDYYDLRFELQNFTGTDNLTFRGQVNIDITVVSTTEVVTVNLKDLNVTAVTVADITNVSRPLDLKISHWLYLTNDEQFEIHLIRSVPIGKCLRLSITYAGNVRTDMTGLYLDSYEERGATKWLAVTQFQPTYARRAFPCYDEPAYKAKFNISVVKQKHHIALSNMPIQYIQQGLNQSETVYFIQTPRMSSYLVAIYVGEFVPSRIYDKYNSSAITVYTYQELSNQTQYVINEAPKHLRVLEEYTGLSYLLPKMDLLAVPDLSFGAMENWGINVYQETYLLLSDDSKARMKMRASIIVQHEFTHQWFGNLVTCKWWDYLWLNEGFAQYFQYFATEMVRPNWPMEELFVIEAFQGALAYDQKPRHPITASVSTPEEIKNVFDPISYKKAALVLRMLNTFVTKHLFKMSLQHYLDTMSQSVAEPSDLFSSFDYVLYEYNHGIGNKLTVNEFMSNWTLQSGYPVLNIMRNTTTNTFVVIQSQFYINKTDGIVNETAAWHIGLTFTTDVTKNFSDVKPSVWTNKESASTVITAPRNLSWYIFNLQSVGLYRVNYDSDNWMALIKQLNDTPNDIHVLNRAQLIDDAFNLARSGRLDYSLPLHLSKYLKNENNTTPWYSAMNGFAYLLERMPRSDKGYANLKSHVSNLAGTIYTKLESLVSSGNTDFKVMSAWETFSTWACRLENKYCTMKAQEYFNKWQAGMKIPADIKDVAFCVGVKNSNDSSIFNNIFELYKKSKSTSEKMSFELALGCSTNRTELNTYINHILDSTIERRYFKSVISAISATPLGLDVLYEFLSTNLNRILNEMPDGEGIATSIYSTLATKMTNDNETEKLRSLKNNSTAPVSVRSSFEKSYENVNDNLAWFNKYGDRISQWALENQEPDPQTIPTESTSTEIPTNLTSITTSIGTTEFSTTSPVPVTKYVTTTTLKPSSATAPVHTSCIMLLWSILIALKAYFYIL